jgi:hypothetical protein
MRRNRRHALSSSRVLLFAVILPHAVAGCGSTIEHNGADAGGDGGESCKIDPPGDVFTFHVHNGGRAMLRLSYGCGDSLPINLDTPKGNLSIGSGAVNWCEVKCDSVYGGQPNNGCWDCGPGYGAPLGSGMTADIKWDRRVYVAHTADPKCTGQTSGNSCALGQAVAPSRAQKGSLTVCSPPVPPTVDPGTIGGCWAAPTTTMTFTIDTTKDEGMIELN